MAKQRRTDQRQVSIDDRYLMEWFEYGYAELRAYLNRRLRFDEYCERREAQRDEERTDQAAGDGV